MGGAKLRQSSSLEIATLQVDLAKRLEATAKEKGVELLLPTDVVVANEFKADAEYKVVAADQIPEGWMVSMLPGAAVFGLSRNLFIALPSTARDPKPCTGGLGLPDALPRGCGD